MYELWLCMNCGGEFDSEKAMNAHKCPLWHVNVGDGDTLTVAADNLRWLEKKVARVGFGGMINAVVRVGHESYVADWECLKLPGGAQ